MEQIIFSKQLHDVYVESRAYGDYEYKQRANWNSPNRLQRERANVLFGRVEQAIFNIANEIDTGDVAYTGTNGDYVCTKETRCFRQNYHRNTEQSYP